MMFIAETVFRKIPVKFTSLTNVVSEFTINNTPSALLFCSRVDTSLNIRLILLSYTIPFFLMLLSYAVNWNKSLSLKNRLFDSSCKTFFIPDLTLFHYIELPNFSRSSHTHSMKNNQNFRKLLSRVSPVKLSSVSGLPFVGSEKSF